MTTKTKAVPVKFEAPEVCVDSLEEALAKELKRIGVKTHYQGSSCECGDKVLYGAHSTVEFPRVEGTKVSERSKKMVMAALNKYNSHVIGYLEDGSSLVVLYDDEVNRELLQKQRRL